MACRVVFINRGDVFSTPTFCQNGRVREGVEVGISTTLQIAQKVFPIGVVEVEVGQRLHQWMAIASPPQVQVVTTWPNSAPMPLAVQTKRLFGFDCYASATALSFRLAGRILGLAAFRLVWVCS